VQGEAELDERGRRKRRGTSGGGDFPVKTMQKRCFLAIYWLDLEKKGDSGGGITPGRTFLPVPRFILQEIISRNIGEGDHQ